MFRANIVGNKIIGPFRSGDGTKINANNYCKFLDLFNVTSHNEEILG